MEAKKIIAVVGATGAQGGGLAYAILNDPSSEFAVRAITRNPDSDKARDLKARGAEVVRADLNDVESLKRAFAGAYGAFCVTNFWEHFSAEKEKEQAANMAEAAADAGLKHVVWSTFEDSREWIPLDDDRMPVLQDKYNIPHFDGKAEADKYFAQHNVPVTNMRTSFYWDNFIYFGMGPKPGPDGVLAFAMPMGDKKLSGMAAEDIGKCAYGVFSNPEEYVGKTFGVAGQHLTGYEMAESLSKAMGQEVRYNAVAPDMYRSFGFPGADELGNMFEFKAVANDDYMGERDLDESRTLNPDLLTFDQWLSKYASKIPLD